MQTEPESPETIALQWQQLTEGTRKVVMFPGGQGQPVAPPEGLSLANDEFGNTYLFRPDLITRSAIRIAAKTNTLSEILGGPPGMKTPGYGEPRPPSKNSRTPQPSADDITLELKELAYGFRQIVMLRNYDGYPYELPPGTSQAVDEFGNIYAHSTGFMDATSFEFKSIFSVDRSDFERLRLLYENLTEHERNYVVWRWNEERGLDPPRSQLERKKEESRKRRNRNISGTILVITSLVVWWWVETLNWRIQDMKSDSAEMQYLREKAKQDKGLARSIEDADKNDADSAQP